MSVAAGPSTTPQEELLDLSCFNAKSSRHPEVYSFVLTFPTLSTASSFNDIITPYTSSLALATHLSLHQKYPGEGHPTSLGPEILFSEFLPWIFDWSSLPWPFLHFSFSCVSVLTNMSWQTHPEHKGGCLLKNGTHPVEPTHFLGSDCLVVGGMPGLF